MVDCTPDWIKLEMSISTLHIAGAWARFVYIRERNSAFFISNLDIFQNWNFFKLSYSFLSLMKKTIEWKMILFFKRNPRAEFHINKFKKAKNRQVFVITCGAFLRPKLELNEIIVGLEYETWDNRNCISIDSWRRKSHKFRWSMAILEI